MKFVSWLLKGTAILFTLLVVLALRPIMSPTPSQCILVPGEVEVIYEGGGPHDVQIRLAGDENRYYINRGAQHGIDAKKLNMVLQGKPAVIAYVLHWTPLDPMGKMRHVAAVYAGGETHYTEFKRR